jgi:hypothetical protein
MNGNCVKSAVDGLIVSIIACKNGTGTGADGNGTGSGPGTGADGNGTDNNTSNLQNHFGKSVENEIKKAYQSYTIFDSTNCGELQISPSAYLFNQPGAEIKDPLPMFRDILAPYRDIIKNFLLFIAAITGLFDFFRRS